MMHLTINFEKKHEERITKAFADSEDSLAQQIQQLVLNHAGQQALNKVQADEDKIAEAKKAAIDEEKRKKLAKVAKELSKELGLV